MFVDVRDNVIGDIILLASLMSLFFKDDVTNYVVQVEYASDARCIFHERDCDL